jgi:hypothetical protein
MGVSKSVFAKSKDTLRHREGEYRVQVTAMHDWIPPAVCDERAGGREG